MHLDYKRGTTPATMTRRRKSTSWSRPQKYIEQPFFELSKDGQTNSIDLLQNQRNSYTSIKHLLDRSHMSSQLNSDRPVSSSATNLYLSKVKDLVHLQTEILSQPSDSSIQVRSTYPKKSLIDPEVIK